MDTPRLLITITRNKPSSDRLYAFQELEEIIYKWSLP